MNVAQNILAGHSKAAGPVAVDLSFSNDLDDLLALAPEQSPYRWTEEAVREETTRFVFERFDEHVALCAPYARYVDQLGYSRPSSPTYADMARLPVIPTYAFKRDAILSVDPATVSKWCTSSGTQGVMSRVGRDRRTLERLLRSLEFGVEHLLGTWPEGGVRIINLGPSLDDAGDIWFGYVMALVELTWNTDSTTDMAKGVQLLRRSLDRTDHTVLLGPPFMIAALLEQARVDGVSFDVGDRMHVLSAGGWKRRFGPPLPRPEFQRSVVEGFGLADPTHYRDLFNQVELNTILYECERHRKHVPPWVYACARDPATLEAVAPGELGLLSFYDSTATSYPGFVVGDDVGRVGERCECGRTGQVLEIERRVQGGAERGCALAIDRQRSGG
jgi:long-chain-fatty-acid---luciferin-component ligase